jgi:putative transposase
MADYRRWYVPGGTYFFTVVTHNRRPFLTSDLGRACLRGSLREIRARHPFELTAAVLLPNHLHTVWTLPRGDSRYSLRWRRIKDEFTSEFLSHGGAEASQSPSRTQHGYRGVWQKRFWEHTCRDEDDLKRWVDYVHWNPVKHGLVAHVRDWPWSSFHRFVRLGEYPITWGNADPTPGWTDPEWGEA